MYASRTVSKASRRCILVKTSLISEAPLLMNIVGSIPMLSALIVSIRPFWNTV